MTHLIELPGAVLESARPDLVEVRFKPDHTLTADTIATVLAARREHFGGHMHHVLFITPEDLDFDLGAMTVDHCSGRMQDLTKSITWAVEGSLARSMVELYYAYFPSEVPVQVIDGEAAARKALLERLPAPSAN